MINKIEDKEFLRVDERNFVVINEKQVFVYILKLVKKRSYKIVGIVNLFIQKFFLILNIYLKCCNYGLE